ncbi:MAG: right-handed parallel beta-helix repeat-containing protein, partial [Hyphomicrobiaceae bacterium]|nr:right-handed parallel beta-helix repeat-containing protein [Hyphomicrobiaceae bacterium]
VDVVAENLSLSWTGGRGIVFAGARASGVVRSQLSDLGEGGITLAGGDRAKLAAARLFAIDNRIVRFARLGRTYKAAVHLEGVGNSAVGNYIAEAPHLAIEIHGNDHEVRLNEITAVVRETSDAGAVYTGRDVTARGTVIRHNFIHDIRAAPGFEVKGIYLDDFASGFAIRENVFLRVDQPVFIGGGSDNQVVRNVFVAASPAIHIDARGLSWARPALRDPASAMRRRFFAMPVGGALWRQRYPALMRYQISIPHGPSGIVVADNIVAGGDALRLEPPADQSAFAGTTTPKFVSIGNTQPYEASANSAAMLLAELARRLRESGARQTVKGLLRQPLDRRSILKP